MNKNIRNNMINMFTNILIKISSHQKIVD